MHFMFKFFSDSVHILAFVDVRIQIQHKAIIFLQYSKLKILNHFSEMEG